MRKKRFLTDCDVNSSGAMLQSLKELVGFILMGKENPSRDVIEGRKILSQILFCCKSLGDVGDLGKTRVPHIT